MLRLSQNTVGVMTKSKYCWCYDSVQRCKDTVGVECHYRNQMYHCHYFQKGVSMADSKSNWM